jgi:hypothetical protein
MHQLGHTKIRILGEDGQVVSRSSLWQLPIVQLPPCHGGVFVLLCSSCRANWPLKSVHMCDS